MKPKMSVLLGLVCGLTLLLGSPANAQQHRATRLGHPTTRFAPPLEKPEDLRDRFRDPKLKPDIASILKQWGWTGNLEDLHAAAATAEIVEVKLPVGTRMVFMSSRENGKPITLRDVLWAGNEPISAYAFLFSSNGRRYRCVTPRPCSNFFLEDLGPEPPKLEVFQTVPASASLCDPIEMKITVRNTGMVPVTQVRLLSELPTGLETHDHLTNFNVLAGDLKPREGKELRIQVRASMAGSYVQAARATSAEGATAESSANLLVQAPVLALDCAAPATVLQGRPVQVCLTLRNTGDAPEAKPILTLPIPETAEVAGITEGGVNANGRITWELGSLAPGGSQQVCVTFTPPRQPGSFAFTPSVRGACAPPAETTCATRILGVPGILLEVVDTEDPVQVGQETTYVITATNQGSTTATNLRFVCTLPESQEYVSCSGATPPHVEGRTVTLDPVTTLESKAQATWRVTVKALAEADARFRLELTSEQFERPIMEEESTHQY